MAFRKKDETKPEATSSQKPTYALQDEMAAPSATRPAKSTDRLISLDAYRGLTMLFMASSGLYIGRLLERKSELLHEFDGRWFEKPWSWGLETLSRQLEHVPWTGCVAWDLIQPSFMFMVGVAMPFSYAHRTARGQSFSKQLGHAFIRSLVLIWLGIFLRSTHAGMTNFTFEDVLTQIGLGYFFVFLLMPTRFWGQFVAVLAIIGASWFQFYHHPLPPPDGDLVTRYLSEVRHLPPEEWNQFTGLAAHWNKHTNAAAAFDRTFLNIFPRPEQPWEGKKFWINGGGYQTLNFVPSMVTMIFGLMAGQLLRSTRTPKQKLQSLFAAGVVCFVVSMAIDTTIWPEQIRELTGLSYSLCPIVKRIWTPSWAVFSSGWTFWFLAFFYWFVDMRGFRRLVFPLTVVGMNSIAIYCMDHLIDGWLAAMLKIHLTAFDALAHTSVVHFLYDGSASAAVWRKCAVLLMLWLICFWMYRRKIFIRV